MNEMKWQKQSYNDDILIQLDWDETAKHEQSISPSLSLSLSLFILLILSLSL